MLLFSPYFKNLLNSEFVENKKAYVKLSLPCNPRAIREYFNKWLLIRKTYTRDNYYNHYCYASLMVPNEKAEFHFNNLNDKIVPSLSNEESYKIIKTYAKEQNFVKIKGFKKVVTGFDCSVIGSTFVPLDIAKEINSKKEEYNKIYKEKEEEFKANNPSTDFGYHFCCSPEKKTLKKLYLKKYKDYCESHVILYNHVYNLDIKPHIQEFNEEVSLDTFILADYYSDQYFLDHVAKPDLDRIFNFDAVHLPDQIINYYYDLYMSKLDYHCNADLKLFDFCFNNILVAEFIWNNVDKKQKLLFFLDMSFAKINKLKNLEFSDLCDEVISQNKNIDRIEINYQMIREMYKIKYDIVHENYKYYPNKEEIIRGYVQKYCNNDEKKILRELDNKKRCIYENYDSFFSQVFSDKFNTITKMIKQKRLYYLKDSLFEFFKFIDSNLDYNNCNYDALAICKKLPHIMVSFWSYDLCTKKLCWNFTTIDANFSQKFEDCLKSYSVEGGLYELEQFKSCVKHGIFSAYSKTLVSLFSIEDPEIKPKNREEALSYNERNKRLKTFHDSKIKQFEDFAIPLKVHNYFL